jgi:hypothetical protein
VQLPLVDVNGQALPQVGQPDWLACISSMLPSQTCRCNRSYACRQGAI